MKCKYCGAEISTKEKICHNCGRFLGEEKIDDSKKNNRTLWIALGVIGVALAFVLTTFGGSFLQQQSTKQQLEKQVAVTSANNLGLKFEKFKDAFNQNEYAQRAKLNMGNTELTKGDKVTTFQTIFSEKLALNGRAGIIDHQLLAIQMIGIPSNVEDDQIKMITLMGILIDTFSPDLPTNKRGEILKELGFDKDTDLYKVNNASVRGNVKYHFKFIENTGFVFSVANVNYQG